jgi:hypothetical protein
MPTASRQPHAARCSEHRAADPDPSRRRHGEPQLLVVSRNGDVSLVREGERLWCCSCRRHGGWRRRRWGRWLCCKLLRRDLLSSDWRWHRGADRGDRRSLCHGGCARRNGLGRRHWIARVIRRGLTRCDGACRGRRDAIGRHERIRRRHLLVVATNEVDRHREREHPRTLSRYRMKPFHRRHPFPGACCAAARMEEFRTYWGRKLSELVWAVQSDWRGEPRR